MATVLITVICITLQVWVTFKDVNMAGKKMIDTTFLYNLAFYSRQFICHLEENIHISIGILVEFPVNGKHTTIHAILATFRKEGCSLFR